MKRIRPKDPERFADVLLYGGIALAGLLIFMLYIGRKSFFSDELDQLGIFVSCGSLGELLRLYATVGHEVAPPLFAVLEWCWYQLVPHTQWWLQLLPAVLTCCGVYVMGLAGRAFGGRLTGALSATLGLLAPAVTLTAGMQMRQYGLLFLIAALTTYCYVLRNRMRGSESWRVLLLYGVAMAGLPYTHYVSVLLPVAFFLIDCVLYAKKRISFRCIVSYLVGAGLFLPWGLTILGAIAGRNEFWLDKPRLLDLIDAVYYLTDGSGFGPVCALFLLGLCITAAVLITRWKEPALRLDAGFRLAVGCVPFFVMGVVFIYSAFLSKNVSLFLARYFTCVIPAILLTGAYAASALFHGLSRSLPTGSIRTAALALSLFAAVFALVTMEKTVRTDVNTVYEPYREAADWLSDQPDIQDETVAVVTSNMSRYVTAGWEALYVTQNGRRESFRIYDAANPLTPEDAAAYDTLYVFIEHADLPPASRQALTEQFAPDPDCDGAAWRCTRYRRAAEK